jgi:Bacterial membrane protein YfhO
MSAVLLYLAVCALLLWLARRYLTPITLIACLALTLLPLAFTGRALLGGKVYAPIDLPYQAEPLMSVGKELGLTRLHNATLSDVYDQQIPWRKAMRYALAQHEWPLLNPFMMCGDILAASAQPAVYSPFNLLGCLLPLDLSLTFGAAIAFFVAGLCAFLFLRDLGVREPVALLGAAAWMYSSFLVFYLEWPLTPAASLLPLIFLGVRRVIHLPTIRSAAILTAGFTFLLLAGHPETALHVVAVSAIFGLYELIRTRPPLLRTIGLAVASGVVALLLCAIYLLPLLEALPQTMEARDRKELFANNRSSAAPATIRARLAAGVYPFANGNSWEGKVLSQFAFEKSYIGSVLFAPILYALWRGRRRDRWFFLGLAVFGVLAGAEAPPIAPLLKRLPLFDIALNQRLVFVAAFALVILAALGLEDWIDRREERGESYRMAACFALAFALVTMVVMVTWYPLRVAEYTRATVAFHALLALVPIALGGLLFLLRAQPRIVIPLLFALLLVQRVAEDRETYPTLPRKLFYPPMKIFQAIRRDRGPFRIVGQSYTFIPNTSALYELEDARGYEAMTLLPLASSYSLWSAYQPVWFNRVDDLSRPFLSMANVRYAIVLENAVPPEGWRRVATQPGSQLFENERALERFFIPREVLLGASPVEVHLAMAVTDDFGKRAWISAPMRSESGNGRGTLRIEPRGLGFRVHASMQEGGWVVISQAAWKGWHATIDGQPVPLRLANMAFLAVNVPTGEHELTLRYLPRGFVIGRAVSFGTLLALLVAGIWMLLPRRGSRVSS